MNVRFFYTKFERAISLSLGHYRWPKYPFPPDEEFIDGELIGLKDQTGRFYLYVVRLSKDTISLVPESSATYEIERWRHRESPSHLPIVTYNEKGDVIGLNGYETRYGICSGQFRTVSHTGPDGEKTWDIYRDGKKMGPVPCTESTVLKEQWKREIERAEKRENGEKDDEVDVTTDERENQDNFKWFGFSDEEVFEVNKRLRKYFLDEMKPIWGGQSLLFFYESFMETQEKDQPNSLFTYL